MKRTRHSEEQINAQWVAVEKADRGRNEHYGLHLLHGPQTLTANYRSNSRLKSVFKTLSTAVR